MQAAPTEQQLACTVLSSATINSIYKTKKIEYGDYIDLYTYNKLMLSFKNERINYTKKLNNNGRRDFSLNRARTNIFQIAEANNGKWGGYKSVFSTLTFKQPITNLATANRHFKYFITKIKKFQPNIKYLAVPEVQHKRQQRTGKAVWHFHIIFFNLPYIDKHKYEKLWGHGSTNIGIADHKGKEISNISSYLSKYLTKDTQERLLYGQRSYSCSRGLIRPIHSFGFETIENIQNSSRIKILVKGYVNSERSYSFHKIKKYE